MKNYIFIFDNYKFVVETDNANNILLSETSTDHKYSITKAIKKFVVFLHQNNIQYISIYDSKLRDRYTSIIKYIFKKGNNTERWLMSKATFINDKGNLLCKIY
jgi:hypothetical protein